MALRPARRRSRPAAIVVASSAVLLALAYGDAAAWPAVPGVQAPARDVPPVTTDGQAPAQETVAEIRVRGNYRTPDDEVLRIAGIATGSLLSAGGVEAVAERLRRSGRFDAVEVRKRYRSLMDESQVALVIVVTERPGVEKGGVMPGPIGRLRNAVMASPTLEYSDGYGVTAGGRFTFADAVGKRGHVSVPLTVGSTRQAAIEIDKTLRSGPLRRLRGSASIASRENPAYDLRDRRGELSVDASRTIGRFLSLGARAAWADVAFGEVRDRMVSYGAKVMLDTRVNPAFPRNAIFAAVSWDTVDPDSGPAVNRYMLDGRAYAGLPGSTVLALRLRTETASGPLPVYERRLLGGFSSLRGFRAGAFTGDSLASASIELRVPFHSPMQMAQTGLVVFGDAGAAYDHGTRLRDADPHYGFGAGWYVHAPLLHLEIDIARGIDRGTRIHAAVGFRF